MNRYWKVDHKTWRMGPILLAGFLAGSLSLFDGKDSSKLHGKVQKRTLEQRVSITGTIEPRRNTIITAPYDGFIKKLFVQIGQEVKAGDPLVSLAQSLQAEETTFPLRAPFAGQIVQLLKTEGQFVKQGDARDYIMRVDDLSQVFVYALAPEFDVTKIKPGMEATIKATAIQNQTYKGIVREIAQAATQKDGGPGRAQAADYVVKIEILDATEALKSGMSSVVDIITAKKEDVLSIEHEFIHRENDEFYVTMKDKTTRKIVIGIRNETAVEVVQGLHEGEEVRVVETLEDSESL